VKIPALALFVALSVLAVGGPARADPYEDAKAAYDRGDNAAAFRLWQPLAQAGDARAQFWLGAMYDLGRGVPQDHAMAASWYRYAAEQGLPNAQHNLAHMYEMGHGCRRLRHVGGGGLVSPRRRPGFSAAQPDLGALTEGHGAVTMQAYKWFTLPARSQPQLRHPAHDNLGNRGGDALVRA
jgi:TPR repeat protein